MCERVCRMGGGGTSGNDREPMKDEAEDVYNVRNITDGRGTYVKDTSSKGKIPVGYKSKEIRDIGRHVEEEEQSDAPEGRKVCW